MYSYLIILLNIYYNCKINGKYIGECVDINIVQNNISFCIEVFTLHSNTGICIPKSVSLYNCETKIKLRDQLIEQQFMDNIIKEYYGEYYSNTTNYAISEDDDCYINYKKLVCLWNIPYCDSIIIRDY